MTRSGASRGTPAPARREPANGDAVTQSMVVRAEQQSEQRFGSAAWCHVSGPGRGGVCTDTDDRRAVRTYFAERTEDEAVGGHRAAAAGPDRPNSSSRKSNSPTRVTLRRRRSAAGIRNGRRRNVPSGCRRWRRCPARPAVKPKPCRPISRGTRRCGTPLPMSHMELRRRPRRRRRLQRPLPTAPPGARQEGGRREGRRALHQGIREPRGSHRLRPPCGRHALHHSTPDIQALMLLTPGYRRRSFRPYMCGYSGLVAPPR
jgi:hypothetical protein